MSYLILYFWTGILFFSPVLVKCIAKKNISYRKAILWIGLFNFIPPTLMFLYNKEVFFTIKYLALVCTIISSIIWIIGFNQIKNK